MRIYIPKRGCTIHYAYTLFCDVRNIHYVLVFIMEIIKLENEHVPSQKSDFALIGIRGIVPVAQTPCSQL